MFHRGWRIVLVAILSCALGVNYTLYTWLDYEILGISKGKMAIGLQLWGYIVVLLGVVLLLTLAAAKFMNSKMIQKQIEIVMALLFVLQLPMISLWFMALFMQGSDAIPGVLLHHLLIGFALYSFLRHQSYVKQQLSDHDDLSASS